jgi:hypothetical protein
VGNAYIVNCTPFRLTVIVNSGTPTELAACSPTQPGALPAIGSVAANTYVVPYTADLNPDQIAGTNNPDGATPNSLFVTGVPYVGGQSPSYRVTVDLNVVPLTSDVSLWMFVDSLTAADSSGGSNGFAIQRFLTGQLEADASS